MSCGSVIIADCAAAGTVLKSDWTVAEFGVEGTDAPRTRSCQGIQRTVLASGGGSAETTSRVFGVVSISAGAVIHPGNEVLV